VKKKSMENRRKRRKSRSPAQELTHRRHASYVSENRELRDGGKVSETPSDQARQD